MNINKIYGISLIVLVITIIVIVILAVAVILTIEIAKKMLKRKMNIEEIQDITGLKKVEIENLSIQ